MKDIVRAIKNSSLIVADLIDSNPNVFYELGLGHALNKPVIMLTQDIEDLPFDLRSYRVIPYTTHFKEMDGARKTLKDLVAGFLSDAESFGGPVSDFLEQPVETISQLPTEDLEKSEAGFLDHLAGMEEGLERLTESAIAFGSKTEELGQTTRSTTERIEDLQKRSGRNTARQMRTLVISLAQRLSSYAKFLSAENDKYGPELARTRTSLEAVVRGQDPHAQEGQKELKRFLSELDTTEDATEQALNSIRNMTDILHEIPSAEKTFDRAKEQAVKELRRFASNVEQTISMIARAKEIAREILGEASEEDN